MLNSAFSSVGVDSVRGESTYYQRGTELRAHKKGRRFAKPGGRAARQVGAASVEDNTKKGVSFSTGLTHRRQAEMQPSERQCRYRMTLAHANRVAALGQMSACIVHEVNQPVAALVTNAQAALRFLEGPNPDLEEVRQALTRIARLGNRVVEVVGRTRALVQRTPPRKDDFEINEAIGEIIALSQGELLKNAVSVDTRLIPGLPLVRADRIQVQQVILNLITNAVEAMGGVCEAKRELRIMTSQTNASEILVTVQDSGPGFRTQNPARLFDAFYSTKPSGLGIGLSICRSIIEAHEGRLWASQSQPHGASFQFTLPVCTYGASPGWGRIDG